MRRLGLVYIGVALLMILGLSGIASASPSPKAFDSVVVGSPQVQQTPGSVLCGDPYTLSTTFQNAGHAPWNSGRDDQVIAVATIPALHSSFLSEKNPRVEPENTGSFTFHLVAPKTAGQYSVNIQLAKIGGESQGDLDVFGAAAVGDVTVTCGAPDPVLTSLKVTPASPSVAVGATVQFDAVGGFSDGSTQDLTSSVTWAVTGTAATISNAAGIQGMATGAAAGTAVVTATSGSISSSPVTLTVTTATCAVGPTSGYSCSVTAEGTSCFVQLPAGGATWVLKDLTTNTPLTGGLTPAFESVSVAMGDKVQLTAATSGSLDCT